MNSRLYYGQVMHQRHDEVNYRFQYGVMSIRVDIDEIETLSQQNTLLSFNRFNLYSLYTKDYGAKREEISWRNWIDQLLSQYGLNTPADRVELVCFPRYFGFTFNPLAMWYAWNKNNELIAIVAEVSNTFGQWHHYVYTQNGQPLPKNIHTQASKDMHVSPFIAMNCEYKFRLKAPAETYQIGIYQQQENKLLLTATQTAKQQKINNQNLLKAALAMPFNTLKVVILIHWWALKIWLKGGKFHATPKHLNHIDYSHSEMKSC